MRRAGADTAGRQIKADWLQADNWWNSAMMPTCSLHDSLHSCVCLKFSIIKSILFVCLMSSRQSHFLLLGTSAYWGQWPSSCFQIEDELSYRWRCCGITWKTWAGGAVHLGCWISGPWGNPQRPHPTPDHSHFLWAPWSWVMASRWQWMDDVFTLPHLTTWPFQGEIRILVGERRPTCLVDMARV